MTGTASSIATAIAQRHVFRSHQVLPTILASNIGLAPPADGKSANSNIKAVGLLNRLETENLITRSPDRNDRRRIFISLTGHGLSVLGKLSHIHREELRRLTPQLRVLLKQINRLSKDANYLKM